MSDALVASLDSSRAVAQSAGTPFVGGPLDGQYKEVQGSTHIYHMKTLVSVEGAPVGGSNYELADVSFTYVRCQKFDGTVFYLCSDLFGGTPAVGGIL